MCKLSDDVTPIYDVLHRGHLRLKDYLREMQPKVSQSHTSHYTYSLQPDVCRRGHGSMGCVKPSARISAHCFLLPVLSHISSDGVSSPQGFLIQHLLTWMFCALGIYHDATFVLCTFVRLLSMKRKITVELFQTKDLLSRIGQKHFSIT